MVTFSDTKPELSVAEVEDFEKKFTISFPVDYKAHLLKHNGGRCVPNVYEFFEKGNSTNSDVAWFFAIYDGKSNRLDAAINIYKFDEKRLPKQLLPIARDSGGNLICISTGSNDYGYIYFGDHESEADYNITDDTDYSNIYIIAKSLPEFFDKLFDLE